jgi:hypothetical protein
MGGRFVAMVVLLGSATAAAAPMTAREAARKWGHALECKPVPDLPTLASPEVTISLDGLTLHLTDKASRFDRVYPVGLGAIEHGRMLTDSSADAPKGLYHAKLDEPAFRDKPEPQVRWAWNYACRFWWKDVDDHALKPVYAGLPFIRLQSPGWSDDGIHGPVEDDSRSDGGRLQRGYVSHGCIRMEPAGILDLYARTRGKNFPVRIVREVERRADGTAVDVPDRWLLSECAGDADCNFKGGTCRKNRFADHGFCTAACDGRCPDRAGYAGSFCVADPDAPTHGLCTVKASEFDNQCKRFPGFVRRPSVRRVGRGKAAADVCLPGGKAVRPAR